MRTAFASPDDYLECARLHRDFGTTYAYAARLFPAKLRPKIDAVYGFVRVPDEWVDTLAIQDVAQASRLLDDYEKQLCAGYQGVRPDYPALRAFIDVAIEHSIPIEEPLCFLAAMRDDLTVARYADYPSLQHYIRGSAAAVGVMLCWVMGAGEDKEAVRSAALLGEAMQMTNFLRDVGEDFDRGRIYLPQDELAKFGVDLNTFQRREVSENWIKLMKFQIARTRSLYKEAAEGVDRLSPEYRRPVRLASILYGQIMSKIELRNYEVFRGRARTTKWEKLVALGSVYLRKVN